MHNLSMQSIQLILLSLLFTCSVVFSQTLSTNKNEYVLSISMSADPYIPPSIYYRLEQLGHSYYDSEVIGYSAFAESEYMGFQLVSKRTWEYLYRVVLVEGKNTTAVTSQLLDKTSNTYERFETFMKGVDKNGNEELIWDGVSTSVNFEPFYQECNPIRYIDPSTITSNYQGDVVTIYPCGSGLCRLCASGEACANELDCQYGSRCLPNNVCSLIGNGAFNLSPSLAIIMVIGMALMFNI